MAEYALPIASLLLTCLATLACLRFLFSRQGLYWIVPVAVSVMLTLNNLYTLFFPDRTFLNWPSNIRFFPIALAFLWYMMVIAFHYALKKTVKKNRWRDEMRKNYHEAKFLEKIERRDYSRFRRKRKREAINGAFVPQVPEWKALDKLDFD